MAEPGEPLSERELDVVRCLARGATNKDIAADLTISENTVKVHLRNIYTKLEVSSRTEATTAAMKYGYIALPGHGTIGPANLQPFSELETSPSIAIPAKQMPSDAEMGHLLQESSTAPARRRWGLAAIIVLLLFVVLAVVLMIQQLTSRQEIVVPEERFAETPIGDSHWLESRPMPDGRANMAIATVGLDLYQIGGETIAGVDSVARAFNSRDRTWRTVAEKPTAVADASAAELYGEIYVVGGRLPNGKPTAAAEAYSPAQDAWRPVASLPHPVSGALTLSDGAFLYSFGGHDGESFVEESYVYDPASDSWRPLPSMPQALASAAGGNLTGKLIVVGGENESGDLADCYQFDTVEETWSNCPDMLAPRRGAGSAVLLNKLYVIGGIDKANDISFSEMFDPGTGTWQVINTPMLAEATNWPHLGVGQIETRIYALGGRKDDLYLDNTYVFAPLIYQTYIPAASSADGGSEGE